MDAVTQEMEMTVLAMVRSCSLYKVYRGIGRGWKEGGMKVRDGVLGIGRREGSLWVNNMQREALC